jgi:hypothetical protein
MKAHVVYFIVDRMGFAWGIAPSKVQARKQMAWFLPRGIKYSIETVVTYA